MSANYLRRPALKSATRARGRGSIGEGMMTEAWPTRRLSHREPRQTARLSGRLLAVTRRDRE